MLHQELPLKLFIPAVLALYVTQRHGNGGIEKSVGSEVHAGLLPMVLIWVSVSHVFFQLHCVGLKVVFFTGQRQSKTAFCTSV
jgi:hypothetical protein